MPPQTATDKAKKPAASLTGIKTQTPKAKPTSAKSKPKTVAELRTVNVSTLRSMVKEQAPGKLKGKPGLPYWTKDEMILALTDDPELKTAVAVAKRKATNAKKKADANK
jgi:hypothetical protein